ncbi:hypothetical protein LCGC14_1056100 [marine sediment metagenome]|uniref:Carbon storage regulator n=1 Tax=marine sediment metagenome TaxID=412755 RepID=A0A0F9N9A8_9ZZZZ
MLNGGPQYVSPTTSLSSIRRDPVLVVTRKEEESITIEGGIVITVFDIRMNRVKLGIVAPGLRVLRTELLERKKS